MYGTSIILLAICLQNMGLSLPPFQRKISSQMTWYEVNSIRLCLELRDGKRKEEKSKIKDKVEKKWEGKLNLFFKLFLRFLWKPAMEGFFLKLSFPFHFFP